MAGERWTGVADRESRAYRGKPRPRPNCPRYTATADRLSRFRSVDRPSRGAGRGADAHERPLRDRDPHASRPIRSARATAPQPPSLAWLAGRCPARIEVLVPHTSPRSSLPRESCADGAARGPRANRTVLRWQYSSFRHPPFPTIARSPTARSCAAGGGERSVGRSIAAALGCSDGVMPVAGEARAWSTRRAD
jgi:hypothetical protein